MENRTEANSPSLRREKRRGRKKDCGRLTTAGRRITENEYFVDDSVRVVCVEINIGLPKYREARASVNYARELSLSISSSRD